MPDLIIVGTDGSPAANAAAAWAVDDAARRGCPVRFVSVIDSWAYSAVKFPTGAGDPLTQQAERALAEAEAIARKRRPDVEVSLEIAEGVPARILREKADEASAVVVVVGLVGIRTADDRSVKVADVVEVEVRVDSDRLVRIDLETCHLRR